MKKCLKCNLEFENNEMFCPSCGEKLQDIETIVTKEQINENVIGKGADKKRFFNWINKKRMIIIGAVCVLCIIALVVIINLTGTYTAYYKFLSYKLPKDFISEEDIEYGCITYYPKNMNEKNTMGKTEYKIFVSVEDYEGYYSDIFDWCDINDDRESLQEDYEDLVSELTDAEIIDIDGVSGITGMEYVPISYDKKDEDYGKYYIYNEVYFIYDDCLVTIQFTSTGNMLDSKVEKEFNKFIKSIKFIR